MTVHDSVQKARLDLANAKQKYREAQVEAWGMCHTLIDALDPKSDTLIGDSLAREFTILLSQASDRARSVKTCEGWLRAAEERRSKQEQPEKP